MNRFTSTFLQPGSKGVVGVTNPTAGVYCIQLDSSIDASKAVLAITPDYEHSTSFSGAIATYAYPDGSLTGCSTQPNSLVVVTGYYGIQAGAPEFNEVDESFTFAVP